MLFGEVDKTENIFVVLLLVITQAICSGLTLLGNYVSFLYMPFADAMTIVYTAPVFTMVLSSIFFKDRFKFYKIFCTILLLFGVILVLQPPKLFGQPKTEDNPNTTESRYRGFYFGSFMAFLSSFSIAWHGVAVGRLLKNSTTNSAMLLAFYAGFGQMIVTLPFAMIDENQTIFSENLIQISETTWVVMLVVVALGLMAFLAINLAISFIEPVYVNFIGVLEIVMAYIIQVVVFHTSVNVCGVLGSMIVALTVFSVPLEKWISNKLPECIQKCF